MSDNTTGEAGQDLDIDIAIVGAGPAGLYTAWRLLQDSQYKNQRIAIFEASERVGGRVLSVTIPEIPFVAELGAMRYVPSQILVSSLVAKLQIPTVEFNFEDLGYRLRGKWQDELSKDNKKAGAKYAFPYRLGRSEKKSKPGDFVLGAIEKVLRDVTFAPEVRRKREARGIEVDELTKKLKKISLVGHLDPLSAFDINEWRLIKRYGAVDSPKDRHSSGRMLYQIGFWEVLQQYLSPEAYNLANDGTGYQSIVSMWNAADAIYWYLSDFGPDGYRTIVSGMSRLPNRLCEEVNRLAVQERLAPLGAGLDTLNLGHALKKITAKRNDARETYLLDLELNRFIPGATLATKRVTAGKVILALPQLALKQLQFENLKVEGHEEPGDTDIKLRFLLDTVTAHTLFKALIFYKEPWWPKVEGNGCFRVFTDLPLRQIYHFGTQLQYKETMTTDRCEQHCALLLYSDSKFADYWRDLDIPLDNPVFQDAFRSSLSVDQRAQFDKVLLQCGATEVVQTRIRHFLSKVSGEEEVEQPLFTIYKLWSGPPHYAGWHTWNMGNESWKAANLLSRPFESSEIYTCGESFSAEQGWIEGALESAERALARLNVPLTWLSDENRKKFEEKQELWR